MTEDLGTPSKPLTHYGAALNLQERTSDPTDTQEGDAWLRVDLTPEDNQIATLRFDHGDGVWDIPLFETGTSQQGVEEFHPWKVSGQDAYIPFTEPDDAQFPQIHARDGGVTYGAHNRVEPGSAIPDSVVYHYAVSNFDTSIWTDSVGSADMDVNGLVASTFSNDENSVFGDGVDDHGFAPGPELIPQNSTFGVAMTCQFSGQSETEFWFGVEDGNNTHRFQLRSTAGEFQLILSDDAGDTLFVETNSAYDDGTPKTVIINKTGSSAADIDFYVDDMTAAVSKTINTDQAFTPGSYSPAFDLGFWCRNNSGGPDLFIEGNVGIFEFNSAPYTQTEREEFVERRPEV